MRDLYVSRRAARARTKDNTGSGEVVTTDKAESPMLESGPELIPPCLGKKSR